MALPALSAGAPLTLFPRWDPQAFVDALAKDEVSIISGVPTMWMSVLTNADGAATPNLRLVSSGGAAIAGRGDPQGRSAFLCTRGGGIPG